MGALALILFVLVIIPMLLWSVIDPRGLWEVTSSWQFRNPEANEPSDSAFAVQRFFAFISLLVIVGGAFFFVSASHRNASARATDDASVHEADSATPYVYPNIYSSSDGEGSDGYAETTVTPSPVDPFPSASTTAVGSGEPVVLFKPVLEGAAGEQKSDSSVSIGVDAFYYSWLPGDHPSAFAAASVVDSKVALGTLDPAQATTASGGESALGEGAAIIVRMTKAVCAVTSVSVEEYEKGIQIAVYGVADPARCGQTTEGAYVAIPLTDEQVAKARSYEAPAYHPLDDSELKYGGQSSSKGKYSPTIFQARSRAKLSEVWQSEETDRQLTPHVLLPRSAG